MSEARRIKTLIDRVSVKLRQHGLSARSVSVLATGAPDTIRDIMRGRMPSADRLAAIAGHLETSVDWLLGRVDLDPGFGPGVLTQENYVATPRFPRADRDRAIALQCLTLAVEVSQRVATDPLDLAQQFLEFVQFEPSGATDDGTSDQGRGGAEGFSAGELAGRVLR